MYWGPSTWMFMHTLAAKIKEDSFPLVGHQLIISIIQICYNLPCPECCQHAKMFWKNVNTTKLTTKQDLINVLFIFHNSVNQRKRQPLFKRENLNYYESRNVIETYNTFSKNFNTRGNMNLINEEFHRKRMINVLKKWLITNIQHFDLTA
jgi:hypothetical protein